MSTEKEKTADKEKLLPSEQAEVEAEKSSAKKKKWPWGVWSTLGWTLLLFILPQLAISAVLPGDLRDELIEGTNIGLNFGVLVIGELITLAMLISILRSKEKSLRDIFVVPAKIADLFLAIPVYGIYLVSTLILFFIADQIFDEQTLSQEQEIGFETAVASPTEQILVFIGLVMLVPFIEEALFRGFVLRGFVSRLGWPAAALFSSVLFGIAHLQINVGIDTFALGMAAAFLVYVSRSIWPAVLLHAFKNAIAFAVLFEYIQL